MTVPVWLWAATVAVTVGVLLMDLVVIGRRPHEPSMREVSRHLAGYVGLATLFGLGVLVLAG